jgi:hypothetical protein
MSAAPAPVPPPSVILELLNNLIKTTSPEDPLYQLLLLALEEVKDHDDDMEKIREEGRVYFSAEDHEKVIAQEQEEWALYYHRVIVLLIPVEVLSSFSQEMVRSSNKEED